MQSTRLGSIADLPYLTPAAAKTERRQLNQLAMAVEPQAETPPNLPTSAPQQTELKSAASGDGRPGDTLPSEPTAPHHEPRPPPVGGDILLQRPNQPLDMRPAWLPHTANAGADQTAESTPGLR
jgi:hypothetical protein